MLVRQPNGGRRDREAFTLVELIVVIGIISLLMGILLPSYNLVRRKALHLQSMSQFRQIYIALSSFASDNGDRYPHSVATIGQGDTWNWHDPRKLVAVKKRSVGLPRAMSTYLGSYLTDSSILHCPSSPGTIPTLDETWQAKEEAPPGAFNGSFCFYWSYEGLLDRDRDGTPDQLFRGPWSPAGGKRVSKILMTDHFGYGSIVNNPPPDSYASCEPMGGGYSSESIAGNETFTPTDYHWVLSSPQLDPNDYPKVTLKSLYLDGHVGTYSAHEAAPMHVILDPSQKTPYPGYPGPGVFFVPVEGL